MSSLKCENRFPRFFFYIATSNYITYMAAIYVSVLLRFVHDDDDDMSHITVESWNSVLIYKCVCVSVSTSWNLTLYRYILPVFFFFIVMMIHVFSLSTIRPPINLGPNDHSITSDMMKRWNERKKNKQQHCTCGKIGIENNENFNKSMPFLIKTI